MLQNNNQLINRLLQKSGVNHATELKRFFEGRCIFITGAAGSIGSELAIFLSDCNCSKIILLDNAETAMHSLLEQMEEYFPKANIKSFIGNICNYKRIQKIMTTEKPDLVFHAAAYKHVPLMEQNPMEAFAVNFLGTKIIADCAVETGVEKFIFVSTDKAVYPTGIMGISKRLAEIYIQSLGHISKTNFVTTRFGAVLGSNGSVFHKFKRQIEKGGPVTLTDRDATRFMMTISEARNLILKAAVYGKRGDIYLHEMGEPVAIIELARQMIAANKSDHEKKIEIEITGLRAGERLEEILFFDDEIAVESDHPELKIVKSKNLNFDYVRNNTADLVKLIEEDNTAEFMKSIQVLLNFENASLIK